MRVVILILLLASFSAWAQDNVPSSKHQRRGHFNFPAITSKATEFNYHNTSIRMRFAMDVRWKIWTLLGEPVEYSEAGWAFEQLIVKKNGKEQRWFPCHKNVFGHPCLPKKVWKKIDIIKAKFSLPVNRARAYIAVDPGVFSSPHAYDAKKADMSFNTPASPNWDKLFSLNGGKYLSAESAKSLFSGEKFFVGEARMVSFSANYGVFFDYMLELEKEKSLTSAKKELVKSIDKQRKQVEKSQQKIKQKIANKSEDPFEQFEAEYIENVHTDEIKNLESTYQRHLSEIYKTLAVKFAKDTDAVNQIMAGDQKALSARQQKIQAHYLPNDEIVSFKKYSRYGYKDKDGKVIIAPKYKYADNFSEGLGNVKTKEGYGYINKSDDWVIPAQFSYAKPFHHGVAIAKSKNSDGYGLINKQGEFVVKPTYYRMKKVGTGLFAVALNKKRKTYWGVIDTSGQQILAIQYEHIGRFHQGVAAIENTHGKYAVINEKGEFITDFKYDNIITHKNNKITVQYDLSYKGSCSNRYSYWNEYDINKLGEKISTERSKSKSAGELCLHAD